MRCPDLHKQLQPYIGCLECVLFIKMSSFQNKMFSLDKQKWPCLFPEYILYSEVSESKSLLHHKML